METIVQIGDKIVFNISIINALNSLREEHVVLTVKNIAVDSEGHKEIWVTDEELDKK